MNKLPTIDSIDLNVVHQFQCEDGRWCGYIDQEHQSNTIADGTWPLRQLRAVNSVNNLTPTQVWDSEAIMAINAEAGLGMDLLMKLVNAIEQAHFKC